MVIRAQVCKNTCSRSPKQTGFSHLPLTKSKGIETSGGETRKEFILVRTTSRRQQASISKTVPNVLKILVGLY